MGSLSTLSLESMEMDLDELQTYDTDKYNKYILGSAEVVGLMCLKVFVEGDEENMNSQTQCYEFRFGFSKS